MDHISRPAWYGDLDAIVDFSNLTLVGGDVDADRLLPRIGSTRMAPVSFGGNYLFICNEVQLDE
jgi:hypothetical protein